MLKHLLVNVNFNHDISVVSNVLTTSVSEILTSVFYWILVTELIVWFNFLVNAFDQYDSKLTFIDLIIFRSKILLQILILQLLGLMFKLFIIANHYECNML